MASDSGKDPSVPIDEVSADHDSQAMTHADGRLHAAAKDLSIRPPTVDVVPPASSPASAPSGPVPSRAMSTASSRPSEGAIPNADPAVGTLLAGRYRIEKLIAKGGMGRVYLATQLPLERRVAVKLLSPRTDTVADPQFVRRFFLEAAICARLQHPNIITVHDYGEAENGLVFMAMEYLDGSPLSLAIKEHGALSADRALSIATQICRGLREAHARGIVHRDLKPGNIMLLRGRDEENADVVKVLDFGLVKVFEPEGDTPLLSGDLGESFDLTRAGILLGSPRYMSPEQIRNENLDPRTDIYSLGVIMYQMVSGRTPFNGKTSVDILHQHLNVEPAPIEGLAPELHAVIFRCMAKAREERHATINDLLRELKHVYKALAASSNGGLAYVPPRGTSGSVGGPTGSMSVSRSDQLIDSGTGSDSLRIGEVSSSLAQSGKHSSIAAASQPLAEPLPASLRGVSGPGRDPSAPMPAVTVEEHTSDQMAAARHAAGAPPQPGSNRLVLFGVIAAVLAGAIGAGIALTRGGEQPVKPVEASAPTMPPVKKSATLLIESRPSGAVVSEGGRALGKTPLALPLDPDETSLRDFEVSLSGYASHAFRLPPEAKDTRVVAELVALPEEPVKPEEPAKPDEPISGTKHAKTKRPSTKTKQTPSKVQQTTETQQQGEPDIRLQR